MARLNERTTPRKATNLKAMADRPDNSGGIMYVPTEGGTSTRPAKAAGSGGIAKLDMHVLCINPTSAGGVATNRKGK